MVALIKNLKKPTRAECKALEKKICEYFELCDIENATLSSGKISKPYTLSGLLFHLGVSKEDFAKLLESSAGNIATKALLRIESFIEENALSGKLSSSAAMNSLKNNLGLSDFCAENQDNIPNEIRITMDELTENLGK